MSTKRVRDNVRIETGRRVLSNQIKNMSGCYTLHWDGKHLKNLTHTGVAEERVAVLLCRDDEEILLGVPKITDVNIF